MFKSIKKNDYSPPQHPTCKSFLRKNIKSKDEEFQLPTNSKKCKKKKIFHSLRKKINFVFENKRKESVSHPESSVKCLRSKSFEVLSNSFEESESQGKLAVAEDSVNETSKWGSRRTQSARSKQTVCPADPPIHMPTNVNSVQTWFHDNDSAKYNSIHVKENNFNSGCAVSNINTNVATNILETNCNSPCYEEGKEDPIVLKEKEVSEENSVVSVAPQNTPSPLGVSSSNIKPKQMSSGPQLRKMKKMNLKDLGLDHCPYLGLEKGEGRSLINEIRELSKYGWYWGPLNRSEAEEKLAGQPDGAFLVRDSSDVKYLLSLSFRSYGKILHARIEHSNGSFNFSPQPDHDSHRSVVGLINHCISESDGGVFCYSRPLTKDSLSFPVRFTKPVSRFMEVRSLQYFCRFVIRQYASLSHIQNLPLPPKIKGYLEESYY